MFKGILRKISPKLLSEEFSTKALQLILDFEGLNQPGKWPGASSGITIGVGYDLAYQDNFEDDWKEYLTEEEIQRLKTAKGIHGENAKSLAPAFSDIVIKRSDAEKVFKNISLPSYIRQTRSAFPGFDNLPFDTQGALVSLVYNRGSSTYGERREEMRAIKDAVPKKDLKEISNQLRLMKRLWPNIRGLQRRRDAEADLVESCITQDSLSLKTGSVILTSDV